MYSKSTTTTGCTQYENWSALSTTQRDSYESQEKIPCSPLFVNPDLTKLVREKTKRRKRRSRFTDHYLFFCSSIHLLRYSNKKNKDNEFISINHKLMEKFISKKYYTQIVQDLIDWGVIERDNHYIKDEKSIGYKLLPPYCSGIKKYKIRDERINKKLDTFWQSDKRQLSKLPPVYQWLKSANARITIDRRAALRYNSVNNSLPADNHRFESNTFSISALSDGFHYFSVDTFGHRAHSNITSLHRGIRRYLSVEGSLLGQVDIRNSQPLFFYLLIRDVPSIPPKEKESYRHLVEEGRFYEFFMDRFGICQKKREKFKQTILTALFFDKNRSTTNRYTEFFREHFPGVVNYIIETKRDNYKNLVQRLQRAESHFVIEKVVGRFIEKFWECQEFISTIHDSIVVKVEMLDEAHRLMKECFQEEGVNPILTIKKF